MTWMCCKTSNISCEIQFGNCIADEDLICESEETKEAWGYEAMDEVKN
jgi:hypothetical protein